MSKNCRRLLVSAIMVSLCLSSLEVTTARALDPFPPFIVNSTEDVNDFVENGVCSIGKVKGGPCTLRAAIKEANAIVASMDVTIHIPEGFYRLQIPPDTENNIRSGDLDFPTANPNYKIKLIGTGSEPSIIDGNQLDRVFHISSNVNIEMDNIHIRGGMLSFTGTTDSPDGAGILNYGNLRLSNVIFEENLALCGQPTCGFVI